MNCDVAVMVDGDNLSPSSGDEILAIAERFGQIDVARVYMNAQRPSLWHDACKFQLVHSGTGKNASDVHLAIDAVALALETGVTTLVIASSDSDFAHLHRKVRERGVKTVSVAETKSGQLLRHACSIFVELNKSANQTQTASPCSTPSDLDLLIKDVIAAGSKNGKGLALTNLNPRMRQLHGIKISTLPERTWRKYLGSRDSLYALDPKGPDAHVRFKPEGFAKTG